MKRLRKDVEHRTIVQRPGYTLIELLIAMSLVVVLMSAVSGLMSMYSTLQTAGAEATAEQQLVRSVMQLLHDDLVAVPLPTGRADEQMTDPFADFDRVEREPIISSNNFGSEHVSVVFDINTLRRNKDHGPANLSFEGSSDAIRMTVPAVPQVVPVAPSREQLSELDEGSETIQQSLPEGMAPTVDEFQTIVYQLQPYGVTVDGGLPFGLYRIQANAGQLNAMLARQSQSESENDVAEDGIRLNRTIIEELLFPLPDDRQNQMPTVYRAPMCDLIPDVVGCGFEYHDGKMWHQSWRHAGADTLPVAIRVTVDVVSGPELEGLQSVFVPDGPPDRLERRLRSVFARAESSAKRVREATTIDELKIVPRSYSSLLLLDSTTEISSTSQSYDLSGEEFGL
jgi:prepilin-type N-terminal cleavage/methylation domain-containing protein